MGSAMVRRSAFKACSFRVDVCPGDSMSKGCWARAVSTGPTSPRGQLRRVLPAQADVRGFSVHRLQPARLPCGSRFADGPEPALCHSHGGAPEEDRPVDVGRGGRHRSVHRARIRPRRREAIVLQLRPTRTTRCPSTFRVSPNFPQFVNVTGNFLNTTVLEIFRMWAVWAKHRTDPVSSPMTGLGPPSTIAGVSVNADVELGRLKLNGGLGVFGEIDTSNAGSYVHQVNGQTLSRIYLFAQDWGPYNAPIPCIGGLRERGHPRHLGHGHGRVQEVLQHG